MKSALRYYQNDQYNKARELLLNNRSVLIQSPTGSGKTALIAAMCESVYNKNKIAWVLVNRKELLQQTSEHLLKWGVPHGVISPGNNESKAFQVHIVSSDTLIRRYDKIKNYPSLLIIDEAHLMLKRQIEIISHLPESSKIVGLSATPERMSGEGLSSKSGGVYDELITGLSIPELTEKGYLCELKYFAPPLEGLSNIKFRNGEADEEELNELLERKKIYGQVVDHYSQRGKGRKALIFCRSIKSAEQTAERFREKGFNFYNIDGTMSDKKRIELIKGITTGNIDGLCGVDIFSYGLNLPNVSYGAMLRPTLSKATYFQQIGRLLRPFPGKENALIFDHVNNVLNFQEDNYPGIPPFYVPDIEWRFHGTEKNKKTKTVNNVKLCIYLDFLYCQNPTCSTCPHNPDKSVTDARKPMIIVPAELQEIKKPVAMADMNYDDRRITEDKISEQVLKFKSSPEELPNVIDELVKIADDCGYSPFWIYHQLVTENKHAVQVHILAAIQRAKNFKPGWIYFAKEKIKGRSA